MADIARISPPVEPVPNDPRMEFMFDVCDGLPAARQKRLIVRAALAGMIEQRDADILIDALNLGAV